MGFSFRRTSLLRSIKFNTSKSLNLKELRFWVFGIIKRVLKIKSLTIEQQAIVDHTSGNALCLAGAGTGKTITLVNLYEQRTNTLSNDQIKVLMFNRDIKQDFEKQLLLKRIVPGSSVKTYHGFCSELLKSSGHIESQGLSLSVDSNKAKAWMRKILKEMSFEANHKMTSSLIRKPRTLGVLEGFTSLIKAKLLSPREVFETEGYNPEYLFLLEAFERFEVLRKNNKILFFDDWIIEALEMLLSNALYREDVQSKLKLLILDEFQDTNTAQYKLLELVKGDQTNVIAVGDINQCIYKWRGSDPVLMLNFEKDFSPCIRYQLSKTFRFGHTLAIASNHLISNNKERFSDFTTVSADGVEDTKLRVYHSRTVASDILKKIIDQRDSGSSFSNIAILLRRWSQAMLLELGCIQLNIPYLMPEDSTLLGGREIGLMKNLMQLNARWAHKDSVINKELIISELLKFPHCYLKQQALDSLCSQLGQSPPSTWFELTKQLSFSSAFRDSNFDTVIKRVAILSDVFEQSDMRASSLFKAYREDSSLDKWLLESEATESDVEETLDKLDAISTVLQGLDKNCEETLQYFEKIQAQVIRRNNDDSGVKLTTIFRAKGAEFDHVFLPFWDAETFPFNHSHSSGVCSDIEEERRLAYVAITRAKCSASIYVAKTITKNNEKQKDDESQFIDEMCIEVSSEFGRKLYRDDKLPSYTTLQLRDYLEKLGRLEDCQLPKISVTNNKQVKMGSVGATVKHKDGTIGTLTSYDNTLCTILFETGNESKFLTEQFNDYFEVVSI